MLWHEVLQRFVRLSKSECCGSITPKKVFIFPKNAHNFWFGAIEKQNIITPRHYGNNSYDLVVLADSEVTFLG